MPPCPFVYWQRVVPGMLYCCREMMHVFLKMDFGFKEILRFREKKGKANLRAFIMPYYRNFMASPRLVSQACLRFSNSSAWLSEFLNVVLIAPLVAYLIMAQWISIYPFHRWFFQSLLVGELQNAQTLKYNCGWDLRIPQPWLSENRDCRKARLSELMIKKKYLSY